jgi:hypothetical protein
MVPQLESVAIDFVLKLLVDEKLGNNNEQKLQQ